MRHRGLLGRNGQDEHALVPRIGHADEDVAPAGFPDAPPYYSSARRLLRAEFIPQCFGNHSSGSPASSSTNRWLTT